MFSGKTARKHVTCFLGKQLENMLPFYREKPWQTYFVFSRITYKEKDNMFTKETVGIKINFSSLFPRKTMNEMGFLFRMQMADGIILLFFLFIYLGNGLNVFQENIDFTCFLTLFSKKTATIPSSVYGTKAGAQANGFGFSISQAGPKAGSEQRSGPAWPGFFWLGLARLLASGQSRHITTYILHGRVKE